MWGILHVGIKAVDTFHSSEFRLQAVCRHLQPECPKNRLKAELRTVNRQMKDAIKCGIVKLRTVKRGIRHCH